MKRSKGLLAILAASCASVAAAQQLDLNSGTGGRIEPFVVQAPQGSGCDASTPGIVIHDDGVAEGAFGWQAIVTDGRLAEKFTPPAYPATFSRVCFSLVTNMNATSLPVKIVAYAADGDGGSPGTVLGSESVTANPVPITGIPFTPTFQSFDLSDLDLNIAAGDVFISVEWASNADVYMSADESTTTPIEGGYGWANEGPWQPTQNIDAGYRALMMRAVAGIASPHAPLISKAFAPEQVDAGAISTLTITLNNNSQPGPATLTSDLTDTFPNGLVTATPANAATTCTGGSVMTTSGSVTLGSGAQIPASGTCTITVDVTSVAGGAFVNTIPAGALVTDVGDNPHAASARLLIIPPSGGNGIVTSGPLDHPVVFSVSGTSLNMVTNAFDDTGPVHGPWDFNFWDYSGSLTFWAIDTYDAAFAVDAAGNALVLNPGDVVGPGLTFSDTVRVYAPAWNSGADGYAGVKFDCDGRLTFPVPSTVCYGYVHLISTATSGFPATIVDTAFDGDGNAITIVGAGPGNPPTATVTPTALRLTSASDATASRTINIANAIGSDPLTYSIAARGTNSAHRPKLVPYAKLSKRRGAQDAAAGLARTLTDLDSARSRPASALSARDGAGSSRASKPWTPLGTIQFVLDDGSVEGAVGLGTQSPATETGAVWVNRFLADGALTIDSISVFWGGATQVGGDLTGLRANLVVYYDASESGDLTQAVRVGTDDLVTVGATGEFETYATNFAIPGAGDVYIGFVDQWALAGGYTPRLFPAVIDETSLQGQSYVSGASTPPTDVTNLANNDQTGVIDALTGGSLAGNWLIRASGSGGAGGTPCTGPVVPWLTAAPASGTVRSGSNASVTVTADPAAGALAAGDYTAELCITTNDPERAVISVPVNLTVTSTAAAPCNAADVIFCDGFDGSGGGGSFEQPVGDPSFEATTDDAGANPNWVSVDTNPNGDGGTLFYSATNSLIPVRTGDWAVWFGGWGAGAETQTFSQSVTLPSGGPLYLNYWRDVEDAPDVPSPLSVSVDGTVVETTDLSTQLDGGDFTLHSIDIGAYADGGAHTIEFNYTYDDSGSTDGDTFVDDVTIDRTQTPATAPRGLH